MSGLRQFIDARRSSRLLAVCIAYALALQALMASVGLGMSAFATDGQAGLVVCASLAPAALVPSGERRQPNPRPQCPFCFIAAQCAGNNIAVMGAFPKTPVYAGGYGAAMLSHGGEGASVASFRHRIAEPRAPPTFSA